MSNLNRSSFQGHPFHLVSPSPWPIFCCISLLTLTTLGVLTMHNFQHAGYWLISAFILLVSSMFFWFRDVISEGTYLGNHTLAVQKGLNMGVALFIVSEVLFFLAIFWAYFHSALSPTVELGAQWPPIGVEAINAFELPLLNTVILLGSGVTITYAHHSLIQGNRNGALYGVIFTIILAFIFTGCQAVEYSVSSFTLTDGAFGSCFYFGTGLIIAPINSNNRLSPFWVTGFSDGESSFSLKVGKDDNRINKIKISPSFSIEVNARDITVLKMIQEFFNVGHITTRVRNGRSMAAYSVQSIKDICQVIIPHFNQYPLITSKSVDFDLFKRALNIMYNNKKMNHDNIMEILSFKASMGKNIGLSPTLSKLFPQVNKIDRPTTILNGIPSPLWLAGFSSAEGMFYVKPIYYKGNLRTYNLLFGLSQHVRDYNLFDIIKDYLKCGVLQNRPSRPNEVNYFVTSLSDILDIVIPFFQQNPILGIKQLDFLDFVKVANIIKERPSALTKEDLQSIGIIKSGMNTGRKI